MNESLINIIAFVYILFILSYVVLIWTDPEFTIEDKFYYTLFSLILPPVSGFIVIMRRVKRKCPKCRKIPFDFELAKINSSYSNITTTTTKSVDVYDRYNSFKVVGKTNVPVTETTSVEIRKARIKCKNCQNEYDW